MTAAASGYDAALAGNRVFSYYRRISLSGLLKAFKPGDRLLELGGGTGEEAVELANRGMRVLLTDVSESQVRSAVERARREGLERSLEARVLSIDDLEILENELGRGAFDGAFSSFGALNCVRDIEMVPSALHALIKPGGRFVCSAMNRSCGWDLLSGLATLRPGRAFRRLWPVRAAIDGVPGARFTVRYFTPREMAGLFRPLFRIERQSDHPLLPPPYLDGVFRHLPGYLEWASGREDGALRGLGDHLFLTMRRLGSD
jgi:SAM-dependent methyltransferase